MSETEYIEWRNLIGDFMIEFARVEDELDHIICDAFPNDYGSLSEKMFKPKACHVISNIEGILSDTGLVKRTKRSLNELIKLADNTRNMIAHYPLEITLEQILKENPEVEIRSRRKREKAITYKELSHSYEQLLKWSGELKDLKYRISCCLYP